MQQGGKVGPSAPNQAPRGKTAVLAAGSKRLTRPVSPDLRTSKRHRASAPGPVQQVHCSDAHCTYHLLAQCAMRWSDTVVSELSSSTGAS